MFLLQLYQQDTIKNGQGFEKDLKGFERSVYWNENITKTEYNNTTYEYRYCPESIFV